MNRKPERACGDELRVLGLFPDAPDAPGGIARYGHSVLAALAAHPGVRRVEFVVRRGGVNVPGTAGVAIHHRPSRAGFALTALTTALQGFDLVLCGHTHYLALGRVVAALARARLWGVFYGIEAWTPPGIARRRAAAHCDQLLVISRYTRSQVLRWARVESWRCRVLPPAVETDDFARAGRGSGRRGRAAPVLLSVSRLDASEAYKGHETVIQAMGRLSQRLPGIRYEVVGDGDDRARLEALCQDQGVARLVRFHGHVPDAQLAAAYADADIFVMPSEGEGFGIVFIEALAAGLKVVAADSAGSVDALRDGDLGALVPARDPRALAESVEAAWRAPPAAPDLGCFSEGAFQRRLAGLVDDFRLRRSVA